MRKVSESLCMSSAFSTVSYSSGWIFHKYLNISKLMLRAKDFLHFKLDFHRVEDMKVKQSRISVISISDSGKMASLMTYSAAFYLFGSLSPLLATQTFKYQNVSEFGLGLASFFHLFPLFDFT